MSNVLEVMVESLPEQWAAVNVRAFRLGRQAITLQHPAGETDAVVAFPCKSSGRRARLRSSPAWGPADHLDDQMTVRLPLAK
jgi:hypothetical protein